MSNTIGVIGAGPAGLSAGLVLSRANKSVIILESDPRHLGGIARTVTYKGFRFDIGGHRFFSKSQEIEDLWTELLPDDMLVRPRSSRIYYRGKFFSYPLKATEALSKLGVWESTLCVASYWRAKILPHPAPRSFEDWVSNQFGKRLFRIFFKTYTEKVWGMDCKEISSDWAAQRINSLSLGSAIKNALTPRRKSKNQPAAKTLINTFRYPRQGPGMLWEKCGEEIRQQGGIVRQGTSVVKCKFREAEKNWSITSRRKDGSTETTTADHLISSAPIRELVSMLEPRLSESAVNAANKLRYRDFLTVALILKDRKVFSDNWIYIHDPKVKVGRIQNFKSWSPEMIPDEKLCCYGLEYFCFEGDGLWNSSDSSLIDLATRELEQVGLAKPADVVDGTVVRQSKAYPVYDDEYQANVDIVRSELEYRFPSLHLVGRNGMHRYNNQDHAMMTGILTAKNILLGKRFYDVWQVNEDAEYCESMPADKERSASGLRAVPAKVR